MKHYESIKELKEHELASVVGGVPTDPGTVTISHKGKKLKTFNKGSPALQVHLDHGDVIVPPDG